MIAETQQLTDSLLLAFASVLLLALALLIWATVLFFKVQEGLERLHRALYPGGVQRDVNGRPVRERI